MPVSVGNGVPNGPITIGSGIPIPYQMPADVMPDGGPGGFLADGVTPKGWAVMHSEKTPVIFPANFATLSPEDRQKILDQYRFEGIKMRADIKDKTIPISRRTMDIP